MTTEHPILFSSPMVRALLDGRKTQTRMVVKPQPSNEVDAVFGSFAFGPPLHERTSPYGIPGDRLWVRETWATTKSVQAGFNGHIAYKSDPQEQHTGPWKPSIHMPRCFSRISLEITAVRVERLQEITEADAMDEGAEPVLVPPDGGSAPHVEGFRALWDTINAKRGFGWDADPWVWVIEFRKVD